MPSFINKDCFARYQYFYPREGATGQPPWLSGYLAERPAGPTNAVAEKLNLSTVLMRAQTAH